MPAPIQLPASSAHPLSVHTTRNFAAAEMGNSVQAKQPMPEERVIAALAAKYQIFRSSLEYVVEIERWKIRNRQETFSRYLPSLPNDMLPYNNGRVDCLVAAGLFESKRHDGERESGRRGSAKAVWYRWTKKGEALIEELRGYGYFSVPGPMSRNQ